MKKEPTQSSPRRQREKADVGEHHRDAEALPGAESVAQKDDRKEKSRQRFRAVQKSHDDGGQILQPAHVAIEGEDGAENDDEAERRRYFDRPTDVERPRVADGRGNEATDEDAPRRDRNDAHSADDACRLNEVGRGKDGRHKAPYNSERRKLQPAEVAVRYDEGDACGRKNEADRLNGRDEAVMPQRDPDAGKKGDKRKKYGSCAGVRVVNRLKEAVMPSENENARNNDVENVARVLKNSPHGFRHEKRCRSNENRPGRKLSQRHEPQRRKAARNRKEVLHDGAHGAPENARADDEEKTFEKRT